jgi:hypothetical protein
MIDQSWPSDQNGRVLDKKNNSYKLCTRLILQWCFFFFRILVVLPNLKTNKLFFGLLILREMQSTLDKNLLRKF